MSEKKQTPFSDLLKPCPFCGGKAIGLAQNGFSIYGFDFRIGCSECKVRLPWSNDIDESIVNWNKRTKKVKP